MSINVRWNGTVLRYVLRLADRFSCRGRHSVRSLNAGSERRGSAIRLLALVIPGTLSRGVRRDCSAISIQVSIEPIDLPLDAFDKMNGFAGARQVVILSREEDDLAGNAEVLQRAEPLFTLFDRNAKILIRMEDQRGSLHIFDVLQRRLVPVGFEFLEDIAAEIFGVTVGAVTCAVVADKVGDAAQGYGRFEPRGVADDPVRHESAIAAAGDAEPVLIDPRIFCKHRVDAIHDVHEGFTAQFNWTPRSNFSPYPVEPRG